MKRLLLLLCLIADKGYSQCLPNISLGSSGGNCVGTGSLILSGASNNCKIVWTQNSDRLDSAYLGFIETAAGLSGPGITPYQLYFPQSIFVDKDGYMYMADQGNRVVKWKQHEGGGITVAGGNGAGPAANQLSSPSDVFVDKEGNVFVADQSNQRIQKWAPGATSGTTVAGGNGAGAAANQLNSPVGVYVDTSGNIYVADIFNHRIQKWAPGAITGVTVAGGNGQGAAANQLNFPSDVFVDLSGKMYILDRDNSRVQLWLHGAANGTTVAGGYGKGAAANQFNTPGCIIVDSAGVMYISDLFNNRVQQWKPGANAGITIAGGSGAGTAPTQLWAPTGISFDASQQIYIADYNNHRVQKWAVTRDTIFTPQTPGVYKAIIVDYSNCSATSNAVNIHPTGTPKALLTANTYKGICSGDTMQFGVFIDKTCINPSYQWSKNNQNITGEINSSYASSLLSDGDIVRCIVTCNSNGCLSSDVAVSDSIAVLINPVFRFIGNGEWNSAVNWLNNRIPPKTLTPCAQIIIDPVANGECVLNTYQRIPGGASFMEWREKNLLLAIIFC